MEDNIPLLTFAVAAFVVAIIMATLFLLTLPVKIWNVCNRAAERQKPEERLLTEAKNILSAEKRKVNNEDDEISY